MVETGYLAAGEAFQKKIPLDNKTLRALSALDGYLRQDTSLHVGDTYLCWLIY